MTSRRRGAPGEAAGPSEDGSGDGSEYRSDGVRAACELCFRQASRLTVHHLVPRAEGGRYGPKAALCSTCHGQLHALFSTATLARELNSLEGIRADPRMASYLRWVRKQQHTANFRVRRAANRR